MEQPCATFWAPERYWGRNFPGLLTRHWIQTSEPGMPPEKTTRSKLGSVRTLAVDIGGTGVKAIILSPEGKALTERARIKTPRPATPQAILTTIAQLAKSQGRIDRISVGFPGVVRNGVTRAARNLDSGWEGFAMQDTLSNLFKRPVRVANDADVQGFGAIKGRGVELVLTLGTGLGSALFVDGRLVPNLELAHHRFRRGKTYEDQLGNAALKKAGKVTWNKRLRKAVRSLDRLFNYDVLYLGGGNAKKISRSQPSRTRLVSNMAGLYGGIALWNGTPTNSEPPTPRKRKEPKAPPAPAR